MIEITIINPPQISFQEVDLIAPVKYNPEINNIERIVIEYKIELRTSLMSPPYSKKSIISLNSPNATNDVGIRRSRQIIPKRISIGDCELSSGVGD